MTAFASSPFTAETALKTPLPPKRLGSSSRSSTASLLPVLAPEGTAADAVVPSSKVRVAPTVGFPRESRISCPVTAMIFVMCLCFWPISLLSRAESSKTFVVLGTYIFVFNAMRCAVRRFLIPDSARLNISVN